MTSKYSEPNPIEDNIRGNTGEDWKPADPSRTLSLMERYYQRWKHVEENLWMYTMKPNTDEEEYDQIGNTVATANAQNQQSSELVNGEVLLCEPAEAEAIPGFVAAEIEDSMITKKRERAGSVESSLETDAEVIITVGPAEAEVIPGFVATGTKGSMSTKKRRCAGSVQSSLGTDAGAIISVSPADTEDIRGFVATGIEGSMSIKKCERAGSVQLSLGTDVEAILSAGVLITNPREGATQHKIVDNASMVNGSSDSATFSGREQALQEHVKAEAATNVSIIIIESVVKLIQCE
ncbi:hypothetical protein BDR04DRAFT_1163812 [Suillus decipiens]|nr:hypothetical protein BDR04DRAFT_1163812 [Suillus decipiens]